MPAKGFSKRILISLVIAIFIGCVFFGARYLLTNFSDFKVTEVLIIDASGKPYQHPERIFCLEEKTNLFAFNIKRLAEDIQARHPELVSVQIIKRFPATLLIRVKEREPVARLGERSFCLIDKEGFILPFESRYNHLPNVIGVHQRQIELYAKTSSARLKKALDLFRELKQADIYPQYNISKIDVSEYPDVILYLRNGIEVKMGNSNFQRKTTLLKRILAQLEKNGSVPRYIDMRFEDPTVMP